MDVYLQGKKSMALAQAGLRVLAHEARLHPAGRSALRLGMLAEGNVEAGELGGAAELALVLPDKVPQQLLRALDGRRRGADAAALAAALQAARALRRGDRRDGAAAGAAEARAVRVVGARQAHGRGEDLAGGRAERGALRLAEDGVVDGLGARDARLRVDLEQVGDDGCPLRDRRLVGRAHGGGGVARLARRRPALLAAVRDEAVEARLERGPAAKVAVARVRLGVDGRGADDLEDATELVAVEVEVPVAAARARFLRVARERDAAHNHLEQDAAHGPVVDAAVVARATHQELWRAIPQRDDLTVHLHLSARRNGEAEVAQLCCALFIKQDIARLDVLVDNSDAVQVSYACEHAGRDRMRYGERERLTSGPHKLKEVAAGDFKSAQLAVFRFPVNADHVRVAPGKFEKLDFPLEGITYVFVHAPQLILRHDRQEVFPGSQSFQRYNCPVLLPSCLEYSTERSFTSSSMNREVLNVYESFSIASIFHRCYPPCRLVIAL
eukprot:2691484-Rhodomonas_salina.2